jgi:MSHA pilin protein MshC
MKSRSHSGFSLVELVTTLVVVAILAAVAIPRFTGRAAFESRGTYDQAQAIVRYAQKTAIAQRQSPPKTPIFVVITASAIRICYDAACVTPINDPSTGTALALAAPGGVSFAPVTTFSFSGSGAPSFGAQLTITVTSPAPDVTRTFFIEAQTGYVHS